MSTLLSYSLSRQMKSDRMKPRFKTQFKSGSCQKLQLNSNLLCSNEFNIKKMVRMLFHALHDAYLMQFILSIAHCFNKTIRYIIISNLKIGPGKLDLGPCCWCTADSGDKQIKFKFPSYFISACNIYAKHLLISLQISLIQHFILTFWPMYKYK